MALTERDRAILDFERTWWAEGGAKSEAIQRCLNLSAPRYYQLLGTLADSAEAMAYDPLVVRRVQRGRSQRRRSRFEGGTATGRPTGGGTVR